VRLHYPLQRNQIALLGVPLCLKDARQFLHGQIAGILVLVPVMIPRGDSQHLVEVIFKAGIPKLRELGPGFFIELLSYAQRVFSSGRQSSAAICVYALLVIKSLP
jgi:hypothetical protein